MAHNETGSPGGQAPTRAETAANMADALGYLVGVAKDAGMSAIAEKLEAVRDELAPMILSVDDFPEAED